MPRWALPCVGSPLAPGAETPWEEGGWSTVTEDCVPEALFAVSTTEDHPAGGATFVEKEPLPILFSGTSTGALAPTKRATTLDAPADVTWIVTWPSLATTTERSEMAGAVELSVTLYARDHVSPSMEMARSATTGDPERTVQLREEELQARKSSVETGRVQLGKDIVEEQRTMDVPVNREEAYVERRPVERRPTDQPIDATESESIEVPIREERVDVEKQPVVYEEVEVGKRNRQQTHEVSETVRREELRADREGEVELRDNPKP